MRNIVLLTFDSVRADHCSYLGYDRQTTPNMDKLAADGLSYANAISPASRTNPSMSGIMTGEPLYYRDQIANPENARDHLSRHGTIAADLSEMGYATGAFCPNAYASRYYGFDRGFDHFEDFLFTSDRYQNLWDKHISESGLFTMFRNLRNFVRREEAFRTWDTYLDDAVQWAGNQDDPFFLWMFSLDTHYPYLTPRSHRTYSSLLDQYYYNWKCYTLIDEFDADFSQKTKQKMIDIYDDSIRFADVLIQELRERLSEFDPVFIIHSDHGEAFGERGMYGHSFPYLYDENVRVPLVISGLDNTNHITDPVPLLGIRNAVPDLVAGRSPDLESEFALSTEYDGRNDRNLTAVRSDQHSYIISESGDSVDRELYDLRTDPDQTDDLVDETSPKAAQLQAYGERAAATDREVLAIQRAVENIQGA
jgi:arylsulfatase